MQALKPIFSTLLLSLLCGFGLQAQDNHCHLYVGILQRGDSLSRAGNYVAAIKTYRAARVACPSKVYETDLRVERIVYRLMQLREQAIQRREEVLQKIALLEKDLERARYNEEVAERRARLLSQADQANQPLAANKLEKKAPPSEILPSEEDPWELLRNGRYTEALPILEASAFTDLQDSLSLMRLAHANLFNGRIEVAESIYRVLKPLPYRQGKYKSFAEAYLQDFTALENAENVLGNGKVIPIPVREAYLRIRTDLENYAQALELAEQERKKSEEVAKNLETESKTTSAPLAESKVENSTSLAKPAEPKPLTPDSVVQAIQEPFVAERIETPVPVEKNTALVSDNAESNPAEATTNTSGTKLRNNNTHSRSKLEEDRPLPPTPEFVMKSLINTEIENKTGRSATMPGQPSGYIVFIGDFDLNDYYAQRTLKKIRDQYGIQEARIRYFSEVLKYRIVLGEFSTKEEAAQYTLNFEQKYREKVWMGVLY